MLKLLREEKELLGDHTTALKNQRDSQMALLRKVEERERQIQVIVGTISECNVSFQSYFTSFVI